MTGYDAEIQETARLTNEKIELADNEKERLNEKLRIIAEHLDQRPTVSITHFVPDAKKTGGTYATDTGVVKKIDILEREIIFYAENGVSDGHSILIDGIVEINCERFLRDTD